jgi:DNA-binding NarL/FixJ family response regulator
MNEAARKLRNAYQSEYRRKNPDKIRKYNSDYWERKADPIGAKVRQLSNEGLSQRHIAEKLNISLGSVNAFLNAE